MIIFFPCNCAISKLPTILSHHNLAATAAATSSSPTTGLQLTHIFIYNPVYQMSCKIGTADFHYFAIQKYCMLWLHRIKHLLKRMIPISSNLVEQFWFSAHFLKCSHFQIVLLCKVRVMKRIRTTLHQDNSPTYKYWSWWVVLLLNSGLMGSCLSGE